MPPSLPKPTVQHGKPKMCATLNGGNLGNQKAGTQEVRPPRGGKRPPGCTERGRRYHPNYSVYLVQIEATTE